MTDEKITDYTAQTAAGLATGDLFETVDISDTTMAATGTNKKMTVTELANGLNALGSLGAGLGVYGDGSDGTVTFDGTTTLLGIAPSSSVYTLTRDLFLAAGTVNSGVTIISNGWRIFCQGTLTNNGTIQWNGNNATSAGGATALSSTGSILTVLAAGGSGATGVGTNGGAASNTYGGAGGSGGTGSSAGGSGGSVTTPASPALPPRMAQLAVMGQYWISGSSPQRLQTGGGGGGGGGDGTNSGGGGGGGGGIIVVITRAFAGTGAIQARGGNGFTPTAGNTGGGGGGGGGTLFIVSGSVSSGAISGQTIDANGGTKGSPHGTGTNNAANGGNGTVILIPN